MRYYRTFRSSPTVMAQVALNRFPFNASLKRDHSAVIIHNHMQAFLFTLGLEQVVFHPESDIYDLRFEGMSMRLRGVGAFGDIFGEHEYDRLPVKNRDVLDIGAYNGDTAVYFCARGASRVIAIEPNFYREAEENIRINRLENKVRLINAACLSSDGEISIDPNPSLDLAAQLRTTNHGERLRVVSLSSCVRDFGLHDAILKMDCEGGEYSALLGADDKVLSSFFYMAIEYHYGSETIIRRLDKAGFECEVVPSENYNTQTVPPMSEIGMIYAWRN